MSLAGHVAGNTEAVGAVFANIHAVGLVISRLKRLIAIRTRTIARSALVLGFLKVHFFHGVLFDRLQW
jgi:hypothetical protein